LGVHASLMHVFTSRHDACFDDSLRAKWHSCKHEVHFQWWLMASPAQELLTMTEHAGSLLPTPSAVAGGVHLSPQMAPFALISTTSLMSFSSICINRAPHWQMPALVSAPVMPPNVLAVSSMACLLSPTLEVSPATARALALRVVHHDWQLGPAPPFGRQTAQ